MTAYGPVDRQLPLPHGAVAEVAVCRLPGIVDQDVEVVDGLRGGLDVRRVGHVEKQRRDPGVGVGERLARPGLDTPCSALEGLVDERLPEASVGAEWVPVRAVLAHRLFSMNRRTRSAAFCQVVPRVSQHLDGIAADRPEHVGVWVSARTPASGRSPGSSTTADDGYGSDRVWSSGRQAPSGVVHNGLGGEVGDRRAADVAHDSGDRTAYAHASIDLGKAHYANDEYAAADESFARALELYRQIENRLGEAEALNNLGTVRLMTGEHAAAVAAHTEALGLYERLGNNRLGQANALSALGRVRLVTGDYEAAAEAHAQALELYLQLGDRLGQAEALYELGRLQLVGGDSAAANNVLGKALELYRELDDQLGARSVLDELNMVSQASEKRLETQNLTKMAQRIRVRITRV